MSSKFGALGSFKVARKGKREKEATPEATRKTPAPPAAADAPAIGRPRGRVRAKRGDAAYTPVSAFMLNELHEFVRDELHAMNKGKPANERRDFSDLLNEWAADFMNRCKSVKS